MILLISYVKMSRLCLLYKGYGKFSKCVQLQTHLYAHSSFATSQKVLNRLDNDLKQSIKEKPTLAQVFVNNSPKFAYQYLKLMRVDRPIGSWLLFWPCSWSICLASPAGCLPDPYLMMLFGCGSFVMRGVGCTINDMWDKDYDKKVARTSSRPLPSGSLQYKDAFTCLGIQLGIGLTILLQLNWYSVLLGASSLGLVVTYPLMKRFTSWPQLVLGLTFNWGTLLGWSAVQGYCYWSACLPLYFAAISWTVIYDTIYAHQDKKDDILIGIKSTALKFGDNTKTWLAGFSVTMMSCLIYTGISTGVAWPYYVSIAASGCHLFNQVNTLQIDNPKDCDKKFRSNNKLGFILFLGCALGSYFK